MPLGACPLNSRLLHTQDRIRLWSGLLIASALMGYRCTSVLGWSMSSQGCLQSSGDGCLAGLKRRYSRVRC